MEEAGEGGVDGGGLCFEMFFDEFWSGVLVRLVVEVLVGEGVGEVGLVEEVELGWMVCTLGGLLFIQII